MDNNTLILMTVAAAVCVAIGFFLGRFGGGKKQQSELQQAQADLQDYKDQVAAHFVKTSALVNQMTESYRQVHQHLAVGANVLCQDSEAANALEQIPVREPQAEREESSQVTESKPTQGTDSAAAAQPDEAPPPTDAESAAVDAAQKVGN